jgi:hypothetical protein
MTKARDLADLGNKTSLDEINDAYDAGALSNRNILHNSEFRVNQRGITSLTGNSGVSAFLADRWITYCNAVNWSASIQEVTLPDGTVTNSLKTVATTTSANAFFHPYQKVEAYGKDYLQGKKVVLSAWIRTNVAGQTMRICDTVNCFFIGSEIPSDGDWHKVYAVYTFPTNMNTSVGGVIQFQPIFTPVNLATNDYCEFALPQMELGSEPTPFEHRSYGDELAKCQRYYYRLDGAGGQTYNAHLRNTNGSGTQSYAQEIALPITMRASPSVTVSYVDMHKPGIRYDTINSANATGSQRSIGIIYAVASADTSAISTQVRSLNVTADAEL